MAEDNEVPKRKGRDPIMMIGSIVLALAFVVVISGYAYGEFFSSENKEPAKYGDRVNVDYVGSYYGWYDEEGAAVFDTSLWSVAGDDAYAKSYEFKKSEEDCKPLPATIGSGSLLNDFEKALIGMKPGDKVRIAIEDAYGSLNTTNSKFWKLDGMEMDRKQLMLVEEYRLTFGLTTVTVGDRTGLQHPYGWTCDATVGSDGYVLVTHNVNTAENAKYKPTDGSMEVKVSDGSSAQKFALSFDFNYDGKYDTPGTEFKLVKFNYAGITYYVTGYDTEAGTFRTKDTIERIGITLYFEITLVGYQ